MAAASPPSVCHAEACRPSSLPKAGSWRPAPGLGPRNWPASAVPSDKNRKTSATGKTQQTPTQRLCCVVWERRRGGNTEMEAPTAAVGAQSCTWETMAQRDSKYLSSWNVTSAGHGPPAPWGFPRGLAIRDWPGGGVPAGPPPARLCQQPIPCLVTY